jgi:acylphosphatase
MLRQIMAKKNVKYVTKDGKVVLMVCFEGKVQMVSFRFTCNKYATELGLGGTVKNMPEKNEVEAIFKGKWEVIRQCLYKLVDEFELTYTRLERLPIDKWPSDEPHWIDYGDGKKFFHQQYQIQSSYGYGNDLGLYGDDFNDGGRLRDKLSKEDRDYIYGDGD